MAEQRETEAAEEPAAPGTTSSKDQFRAALERKRTQQHGNNGPGHDSSKIAGEHSRAGGKRTFRRKSG